jgi:hypothetical protein
VAAGSAVNLGLDGAVPVAVPNGESDAGGGDDGDHGRRPGRGMVTNARGRRRRVISDQLEPGGGRKWPPAAQNLGLTERRFGRLNVVSQTQAAATTAITGVAWSSGW